MERRLVAGLVLVFLATAACGSPGSTPSTGPGSPGAGSLTGSSLPTASPAPTPSPSHASGSLTCSLPINRAGTAAGAKQAHPSAVLIGRHTDYDRIVFVYSGTLVPSLRIATVHPPFTKDPSGLPMTVAGSSFVQIRLEGVQAGYSGRTSFAVHYPELVQLARQGDNEAVQSWIAGLAKPACVRLSLLKSPIRLVIDLQH